MSKLPGYADSNIKQRHYRWRLSGGKMPLYRRHMRSLEGYGMNPPLRSWIRTRLEWTMDNMTPDGMNGVLCIDIREDETVTMQVKAHRDAPAIDRAGNVGWGDADENDGAGDAGVGQAWSAQGNTLTYYGPLLSATSSLAAGLAKTEGYEVREAPAEDAPQDATGDDERFHISDEFFVISQDDEPGPICSWLIACFDKLI